MPSPLKTGRGYKGALIGVGSERAWSACKDGVSDNVRWTPERWKSLLHLARDSGQQKWKEDTCSARAASRHNRCMLLYYTFWWKNLASGNRAQRPMAMMTGMYSRIPNRNSCVDAYENRPGVVSDSARGGDGVPDAVSARRNTVLSNTRSEVPRINKRAVFNLRPIGALSVSNPADSLSCSAAIAACSCEWYENVRLMVTARIERKMTKLNV